MKSRCTPGAHLNLARSLAPATSYRSRSQCPTAATLPSPVSATQTTGALPGRVLPGLPAASQVRAVLSELPTGQDHDRPLGPVRLVALHGGVELLFSLLRRRQLPDQRLETRG